MLRFTATVVCTVSCWLPAGHGLATAAALAPLPDIPKLEPAQINLPFVVENAKAVAGIGMAVLGSGLIIMVLLSLLGNCGLPRDSSDEAYAPAAVAVEVTAHKRKVRINRSRLAAAASHHSAHAAKYQTV